MGESRCTGDGFQCPVEITLSVIGGKWKAVLLWHLRAEVLRFGELKRQLPIITQKNAYSTVARVRAGWVD